MQIDANKSGIRFRSDKLSQLNSDYLEARDQYSEYQKAVVSEVIGIAGMCVCICNMILLYIVLSIIQ